MPIVPISEFSRGQNSRPVPSRKLFLAMDTVHARNDAQHECPGLLLRPQHPGRAGRAGRNHRSRMGGTTAETWTPRECVMSDPVLCDYPYESNPWFPAETGTLYNSMIYPVMPYGIAGCIWYQGEANQGRASSYARVMQRLIGSWRTGFNKEFPFYLVQIAPSNTTPKTTDRHCYASSRPCCPKCWTRSR